MVTFRKSTVLVAIREPVTRWGLIQLIDSHSDLRVVGEADGLTGARELCTRLKPDVVIVDPAMSGGCAFIQDVRHWSARAQVVAFTGQEDAASVERAFTAGVTGYVTRLDSVAAVIGTILGASRGERCIGPRLAHVLRECLSGTRGGTPAPAREAQGTSLRGWMQEPQAAQDTDAD